MSVTTIDLTDDEWHAERDEITRRFFGISAAQFVAHYRAGDHALAEPSTLSIVLAYFPELD